MGAQCFHCVARDKDQEPAGHLFQARRRQLHQRPEGGSPRRQSEAGPLLVRTTSDGSPRTPPPDQRGRRLEDDYSFLKLPEVSGGYGTVRITRSKTTGESCALKEVKKNHETRRYLRKEIDINLMVNHPNIAKLQEVYEDRWSVFMVFELCQGGDLLERFVAVKYFSEADALIVLGQLLFAVNYLHSKGVAHRDLKLNNMLLTDKGAEISRNTVKLTDFGLATHFGSKAFGMTTSVGTLEYVAPEVLIGDNYDEKCDVWSSGVILYILLSGIAPFFGTSERATIRKVKVQPLRFSETRFGSTSGQAKELMAHMLERKVEERFTSEQALLQLRAFWAAAAEKIGSLERPQPLVSKLPLSTALGPCSTPPPSIRSSSTTAPCDTLRSLDSCDSARLPP